MRQINLFLIKTPFQLLNAIELKKHSTFNKNGRNVLINIALHKNAFTQIVELIDDEWDEVIHLIKPYSISSKKIYYKPLLVVKKYIYWMKWLRWIKHYVRHNKIENIISGNYLDPIFNIAVSNVKYSNVVALDDGLATYDIVKAREKEKSSNISEFYLRNKMFRNVAFNINSKPVSLITFFSIYEIRINPPDIYIQNHFVTLNKKCQKLNGECFIIGGPFIRKDMISRDHYLKIIDDQIKKYPDTNIVYIPHPQEEEKDLVEIEKLLKVKRINMPIELFCYKNNRIPNVVIGFYSTALINLKLLYKDIQVVAINVKFKSDKILITKINDIYKSFKESYNIKVINF